MNRLITKSDQFSFPARELPQQLLEHIDPGTTGYWQHQFDRLADRTPALNWNLAIANGQILYSGNRTWSVQALGRVVQRYIPRTRSVAVKAQLNLLKSQSPAQTPAQFLAEIKKLAIIDDAQLIKALRTKILNDLDLYLLMGSGSAKFIVDRDVQIQLPVAGFSPIMLLDEAKQRQLQWYQLKQQVPSMNLIPILDREAMAQVNFAAEQQRRIEKMVQSGATLNSIADDLARDTLDVAEMFAKLVRVGVISLIKPQKNTPQRIMVIDDSPVLLTQFQHWVSVLGYPVTVCQDAEKAMEIISQVKPSAIFIDINMPVITGFELVKQIRQQPQLAEIPLVILTGEDRLSNKWRAQWSGCTFLTKPLTFAEISDFQVQLEELLPRLLNPRVSLPSHQHLDN